MKKYLLLLVAIFMSVSCSTTHKVKTSETKKVDNTTTAITDTTNVAKAQTYTDNFVAKGVDVTFDYNNDTANAPIAPATGDTVAWKPYYTTTKAGKASNDIASIIQNAVAHDGSNGNLSRVTVHIDSLGNASIASTTSDSSHGKSDIKTNVKSDDHLTTKDKTTTGMSPVLIIILVLAGLGLIIWGAFKLHII